MRFRCCRPQRRLALGALLLLSGLLLVVGCSRVQDQKPPVFHPLQSVVRDYPDDPDVPDAYVRQWRDAHRRDPWAIPYVLLNIATHFTMTGDDAKADRYLRQALDAFQKRKNWAGQGTALCRMMAFWYPAGRREEVAAVLREKAANWRQPPLRAFIAHGEGLSLLWDGRYARAQDLFRQSLAENPFQTGDMDLLLLRRDSEAALGMAMVLAVYEKRLSKHFATLEGARDEEPQTVRALDDGAAHLRQAQALGRDIRLTALAPYLPQNLRQIMEADIDGFLGLAAGLSRQWERAHQHLAAALDLSRKSGYRWVELQTLIFLNQIGSLSRDLLEGLRLSRVLSEFAETYQLDFYQVWGKQLQARYYVSLGDNAKAVETLQEAVALCETFRSDVLVDVWRSILRINRDRQYEWLVDLLNGQGEFREAWRLAEKAKARHRVDLFAHADFGRTAEESALLAREKALAAAMGDIQRRVIRVVPDQVQKGLLQERQRLDADYEELMADVMDHYGERASWVLAVPLSVEDVQGRLDVNTTLLDYYMTDETLYIWVITRDHLRLVTVRLSRDSIRGLVASLRKALAAKDRKKEDHLLQRAYEVLMKPAMVYVGGDRIGVLAHDALLYLPFSALSYRGKYLIEGFSFFQLPDIGAWQGPGQTEAGSDGSVLLVEPPESAVLNGERTEILAELERIRRRMTRSRVFTSSGLTDTTFRQALEQYDFLYFMMPTRMSPEKPLAACLAVPFPVEADDCLTALAMARLPISGTVVMNSQTDPLPEGDGAGDEIAVFPWAFLSGGSPAVVMSLWWNRDRLRLIFMDAFFRYLDKRPDAEEALRRAQLEMIQRGHPPHQWAGFAVMNRR